MQDELCWFSSFLKGALNTRSFDGCLKAKASLYPDPTLFSLAKLWVVGSGHETSYNSGAVVSLTHQLDTVLNSAFSEAAAERSLSAQRENMERYGNLSSSSLTTSEGVPASLA